MPNLNLAANAMNYLYNSAEKVQFEFLATFFHMICKFCHQEYSYQCLALGRRCKDSETLCYHSLVVPSQILLAMTLKWTPVMMPWWRLEMNFAKSLSIQFPFLSLWYLIAEASKLVLVSPCFRFQKRSQILRRLDVLASQHNVLTTNLTHLSSYPDHFSHPLYSRWSCCSEYQGWTGS